MSLSTTKHESELFMKSIQVYDPPLCCATGVCGTGIDSDLINVSTMLTRLSKHGIAVERYNLGQQPQAFAENLVVKTLLEHTGTSALPVVIIDGKIQVQGRYPNAEERSAMVREALGNKAEALS